MYEQKGSESYGYLLKQGDAFYTIADSELTACDIEHLTAAMFLKYGFEELPTAEVLTPLVNPEFYFWKASGSEELLKATVKAYPYPQVLTEFDGSLVRRWVKQITIWNDRITVELKSGVSIDVDA